VNRVGHDYEYDGCTFNLLDTPGHQDFSEDTYRTLTAVDSAVMVIDAAKASRLKRSSSSKSAATRRSHSHLHQQAGSRQSRSVRPIGEIEQRWPSRSHL